jgi:hypothetical protein
MQRPLPSLLLVAEPGTILPGVKGTEESFFRCSDTRVISLISQGTTRTTVVEVSRTTCPFVYFARHEHHRREAEIVRRQGGYGAHLREVQARLPTAKFAFFFACHAAKQT